jgi:kynurenine formamidase
VIITICHNNQNYGIDTKQFVDISIPYKFNGEQPNFYNVNPGHSTPLISGETIYSVGSGAGCNVTEISMNIHCTGTHTECVGHLLENPGDVGMVLKDIFFPAVLITVDTTQFVNTNETYHCSVNDNELVICKKSIQKQVNKWKEYQPQALIIRTTPNSEDKKFYQYTIHPPFFFTNDALRYIADLGIQHFVVDLPSIDRISDNGILGNHRLFWGDGENATGKVNPDSINTITELAFIPNEVLDGFYFLNIQLPHFECDAAPSRPILIKSI